MAESFYDYNRYCYYQNYITLTQSTVTITHLCGSTFVLSKSFKN